MKFTCLDPRKNKKKMIRKMLGFSGKIIFLRFARVGFKVYPEANDRALMALNCSKNIPRSKIFRALKLALLKAQYSGSRNYFEDNPSVVAVVWNGLNGTRRVFADAAKDAGNLTLFFELSPFKGRITIDPKGVNYANSLPRLSRSFIDWRASKKDEIPSWHELRDTITQRKPSHNSPDIAPPVMKDPYIFVPLQVPGDSQLRIFGGNFKTVERFVSAILEAAKHCPEGWQVRVKEHPSAKPFVQDAIEAAGVDNVVLDNVTDTFEQVKNARLVVTVNSSVGLEAMCFDKPVVACGDCFWAIDGVASTAETPSKLASVFADPCSVIFDDKARDAFLTFLDQVYYPRVSEPEYAKIEARLFREGEFSITADNTASVVA